MSDKIKERRRDKNEIVKQLLTAGCRPSQGKMWHCGWHNDKTASSWLKLSKEGFFYFKCFTCNIVLDVFDIEARVRKVDVREILKEYGTEASSKKYYYKTQEELIESLNAIEVEEINPYTDPDTGHVDLLIIRYIERGNPKKQIAQAYETDKGYIKKRPSGLLPLFNRARIKEDNTILYVEGEKCVRALQKLDIVATTGSGGASNADAHDYSLLAGKTVFLWPDNDEPGQRYMEQVQDKLLALDPLPVVYLINPTSLDLPDHGDVVDLIERVKAEGGKPEDCKIQIELVMAEANESNRLGSFEELLEGMRNGTIENLPIHGFPILTNEAMTLLNQQITVIFGSAGMGKTMLVGKMSDDLKLSGIDVIRLQLEDALPKHLLRTFAQQLKRAELTKPDFHKNNPIESEALYNGYKEMLDTISATIIADEMKDWNVDSIITWIEQQLKAGKQLIIVDPASVIMVKEVYLASHKLMWAIRRLLVQYPKARVILVTHPNAEGDVAGGQAFKRFCNNLLQINRFKEVKSLNLLKADGTEEIMDVGASIGIVKTRDGSGTGLEIAIRLNPDSICIEELGVILKEVKEMKPRGLPSRNLERENSMFNEEL